MNCPNCGERLRVKMSIRGDKSVIRYRQCEECKTKVYTQERAITGKEFYRIKRRIDKGEE